MKKNLLFTMAAFLLVFAGFAQPTLTLTTAGNCWNPNGPNTLSVTISNNTGPSTYSWSAQGPNCNDTLISASGFDATFELMCCGMHTVTCQVYQNSTLCCTATGTVILDCPPTVSIAATSTMVCMGSSTTLTASGANSYAWNNGVSGPTTVVTPSALTCYSVIGTDINGCQDIASVCVAVAPLPNVTIQNNSPVICQGTLVSISASGAMSYSWSNGAVGASLIAAPLSNICYTVTGSDGICTNTASTCFTVLPTPTLLATNFQTVCLGSSTTLTAATAATYTWLTTPPVFTNTMSVLPAALTIYTVSGTGSNGCVSQSTIQVTPDPSCAMVWPGDANSDGVVNATDVIELGLYNASTGPARTPGGITYMAQFANAWSGTGSNSQNRSHVDCNGDGTVNAGDTAAILANFSLTHNFRVAGSQAGDDIWMAAPPFIANSGGWIKVDIGLGSATNAIQNIYGVVFDVEYQSAFVDNDQVYVTFPASFLDAGNQNIPFRRVDATSSQVNCVSVRTDGSNVSGNGKIAEFWFNAKAMSPTGPMTIDLKNVRFYDNNGHPTPAGDANAIIHVGPVGLSEHGAAGFILFPNPAKDNLTVYAGSADECRYTISDLTGRLLAEGQFTEKINVDVSGLVSGTYIITVNSEQGSTSERFIRN